MKALAQLIAIARIESKLLWRGRVIRVITGALFALIFILALVIKDAGVAGTESHEGLGRIVTLQTWSILGMALLLVPVLIADTIPKDHLLEVRELLDSTPLTIPIYLAGKVLGIILGFIVAIGLVLILGAGVWRITLGEYSWTPYLEMILFGALPLLVINSAVGVLLPATQTTRRRAVGLVLMVVLILPFMLVRSDNFNQPTMLGMASPLRGPIVTYFLNSGVMVTQEQLITTIVLGFAEVIILGMIVWGGIAWHNKRI